MVSKRKLCVRMCSRIELQEENQLEQKKKIFSICVFVSQANNGGRTPVSEGAPPVALTAVPFFFALGACVYSILATLE